jgi:aryl-alcohol dehydrogenase-like predicted oxidoreductase
VHFGDGSGLVSANASEDYVGRWWRERRVPRAELFLATRVVFEGARVLAGTTLEQSVRAACEASLRRLQTDHIDLLLLEWGGANVAVDDLLVSLARLRRAGLIRYSGAGGLPAWRVMESIHRAVQRDTDRFEAVQADFSLLAQDRSERDLLDLCRTYRVGFLARSPLAGGLLAEPASDEVTAHWRGRRPMFEDAPSPGRAVRAALAEVAAQREVSGTRAALAWVLAQPEVTAPVIGVASPAQLRELLAAPEMTLSPAELDTLTRAAARPAAARFSNPPPTLISL